MSNRVAMILGLVALAAIPVAYFGYKWVEKSDFDRICSALTGAVNDPAFARMDPALKSVHLAEKIEKAIWAPPAAQMFQAIAHADPSQRVALIQAGAQEVLGEPWNCPALSQVFPTTPQ